MAYVKILYQDSPSTATPINAQNLNHMDDQIALNDQRLTEIETSYVKSFKGRTGDVVPEKGDYDINQINATDGQNGYVPVWRNSGTEESPDWGFNMEPQSGSGTGGHTIVDQDGTAMASEDDLQFADAFVSDDSVNGRTVVENIKEVLPADYDSTTDEGIIVCDDGNDVPIGEIEVDSVSVTADGVKTIGQLLNDLYSITDTTKIGEFSVLKYYSSKWGDKNYAQISATVGGFLFVQNYTYSGHVQSFAFKLANGNSSYIESDNGTTTDKTSILVPQSGSTITLYYGTSSTVINLKTRADYCMMPDGETSVESYISSLGNHKAEYITLGKGWKGYAYAFVPMLNANQYTITITEAIVYGGSQSPIDITSSVSVGNKTRDGFNIEMSNNTYVGECVRLSFTVS